MVGLTINNEIMNTFNLWAVAGANAQYQTIRGKLVESPYLHSQCQWMARVEKDLMSPIPAEHRPFQHPRWIG